MKNIQHLTAQQNLQRNPGASIGEFLVSHSNSPAYLVSQLEAYLKAAKADVASSQTVGRCLMKSIRNAQ